MDPIILLIIVGVVALIIILGTAIAVLRVVRQPQNSETIAQSPQGNASAFDETSTLPQSMMETLPVTDSTDFDVYLAEQRANLSNFELSDLSNSFKGTTEDNQRTGVILRLDDSEKGLIIFTSEVFNTQNGLVQAETAYGKMELFIAQGRADIKWDDNALGALDYTNQRIMSAENQLLGSMERPVIGQEAGYYSIGFFGQKAAEVTTQIGVVSPLRWFDNEDTQQMAAFQDIAPNLEDSQTLLLLGALLLEVGFIDLQRQMDT